MSKKETGKVIWFDKERGYGFINRDSDGKSIFVHWRAIKMEGYRELKKDQKVSFFVEEHEGKQRACKVVVIEDVNTEGMSAKN